MFINREGSPVMWQEAPVSAIQVVDGLEMEELDVHMHMSACGESTWDGGVEHNRVQLAIAWLMSPQKWHCVWLLAWRGRLDCVVKDWLLVLALGLGAVGLYK